MDTGFMPVLDGYKKDGLGHALHSILFRLFF